MKSTPLATERYVQLIRALGEEWGYRRGWQSRAAEQLGVHRSYVGQLLRGDRVEVGIEAIRKAMTRLNIPERYFTDPTPQHWTHPKKDAGSSDDPYGQAVRERFEEMRAAASLGHPAIELWVPSRVFARRVLEGGEHPKPRDIDDLARSVVTIQPMLLAQRILDPSITERQKYDLGWSLATVVSALSFGREDE